VPPRQQVCLWVGLSLCMFSSTLSEEFSGLAVWLPSSWRWTLDARSWSAARAPCAIRWRSVFLYFDYLSSSSKTYTVSVTVSLCVRLQVDEVSAHYLNISIIEDVNSWNTDVVIMAGGICCFNNKFSSITKYRFSICLTARMWCWDCSWPVDGSPVQNLACLWFKVGRTVMSNNNGKKKNEKKVGRWRVSVEPLALHDAERDGDDDARA